MCSHFILSMFLRFTFTNIIVLEGYNNFYLMLHPKLDDNQDFYYCTTFDYLLFFVEFFLTTDPPPPSYFQPMKKQ